METKHTQKIDLNQIVTEMKSRLDDRVAAEKFFKHIIPLVNRACKWTMARFASKQRAVEAQDLAQTVCEKIWAALPGFNPAKGRFSTWVWTITQRSWFDVLNASEARFLVEVDEECLATQPENTMPVDEEVDARLALHKIESALPHPAFELVIANASGLSAQDIADIQGMNVDTVKSRIRVARNRAAAALDCITIAA